MESEFADMENCTERVKSKYNAIKKKVKRDG